MRKSILCMSQKDQQCLDTQNIHWVNRNENATHSQRDSDSETQICLWLQLFNQSKENHKGNFRIHVPTYWTGQHQKLALHTNCILSSDFWCTSNWQTRPYVTFDWMSPHEICIETHNSRMSEISKFGLSTYHCGQFVSLGSLPLPEVSLKACKVSTLLNDVSVDDSTNFEAKLSMQHTPCRVLL